MENQQTQQAETSVAQAKKGNGVKHIPIAGLILGIIATAVVIIWFMQFPAGSMLIFELALGFWLVFKGLCPSGITQSHITNQEKLK